MDISEFQKAEKNQYYIAGMRPVINKEALFSDTTRCTGIHWTARHWKGRRYRNGPHRSDRKPHPSPAWT